MTIVLVSHFVAEGEKSFMSAFQWDYDSVLEHSGISSYSITHYTRLCFPGPLFALH